MGMPDESTLGRPTPLDLSETTLRRGLAVMCLVGIAVIHLMDLPDKIEEVPYIGALFIGLIVASLLLAEAIIRSDDMRVWAAAGLLAASTMVAYALSRSVGLPGEGGEEIGNWSEALGLAALLVEAVLVWLVVARLLRPSPNLQINSL
jgi:hypothetical protein